MGCGLFVLCSVRSVVVVRLLLVELLVMMIELGVMFCLNS